MASATNRTMIARPRRAPRRRTRRRSARRAGVSTLSTGFIRLAVSVASAMSRFSQSRIDQDVGDVSDQVERDVHGRRHQDDTLHHGIIAVEYGVDDQFTETRNGEYLLGENRAGEQCAELERAKRDDRRERVAHRMFEDDGARGGARGPRGARIVAVEYLEHGAAGVT